MQTINKVNQVQKSLLSEVLLSLLIAVRILVQDNGSKEPSYVFDILCFALGKPILF